MPKYARFEHERRFVVVPARCPPLDPASAVRIDDLYLAGRLRLRRNTAPDGTSILKLAKKYPGPDPMSRPMTNLYLDAAEFALLDRLPGRRLTKQRCRVDGGFVIDRFAGLLDGLILAEFEADRAAVAAVAIPDWAAADVTADQHYDGGTLSRWTAADVAEHRRRFA